MTMNLVEEIDRAMSLSTRLNETMMEFQNFKSNNDENPMIK
jgi:hypothetical protein